MEIFQSYNLFLTIKYEPITYSFIMIVVFLGLFGFKKLKKYALFLCTSSRIQSRQKIEIGLGHQLDVLLSLPVEGSYRRRYSLFVSSLAVNTGGECPLRLFLLLLVSLRRTQKQLHHDHGDGFRRSKKSPKFQSIMFNRNKYRLRSRDLISITTAFSD